MNRVSLKLHLIFVCSLLLLASCATREPVTDRDQPSADGSGVYETALSEEGVAPEEMEPRFRLLYLSRSRLSDLYSSLSHDMPEVFLQTESISGENVDVYAGFRIQLLSTRNVSEAESLKREYDVWADTTFKSVVPDSYIFFRQPNYRVRIGDFYDREEAVALSRFIKNRYPEAWVVHDRINPERVLPDSVHFQYRSESLQ